MNSRKISNIRLAALAATTLVVAACGGGGGGDGGYTPPPANSAPAVSTINDRATDQDTMLSIDFSVDDRESGAGSLAVMRERGRNGGVSRRRCGALRKRRDAHADVDAARGHDRDREHRDPGRRSRRSATTRSFAVAVNAKNNSLRAMALETFAKAENDMPTTLNGWTIQQDADDPAAFAGLIPAEDP